MLQIVPIAHFYHSDKVSSSSLIKLEDSLIGRKILKLYD